MGCRLFTDFSFRHSAMDCCAGRSSNQRRLILLICVSSSGRQTGLIDLTTVRVAALPLSRLEGPNERPLNDNEGSPKPSCTLPAHQSTTKLKVVGFGFWSLPRTSSGRAQSRKAGRSQSRRDSGEAALPEGRLIGSGAGIHFPF